MPYDRKTTHVGGGGRGGGLQRLLRLHLSGAFSVALSRNGRLGIGPRCSETVPEVTCSLGALVVAKDGAF